MRWTFPDPRGRVVLGTIAALALVATISALVVGDLGGEAARASRPPGAVRPATGGLVAPAPDHWLRLRAEAASRGNHHRLPPASPRRPHTAALPTTGGAIPVRVLRAYVGAARATDRQLPSCHLTWSLLAGIGFIESGHAHSGGSDDPRWNGLDRPPIYGPLLDGTGRWGAFADTDGGRLDGNRLWDRAVGPMQFMPSTWSLWGADGNRDGHADPQQVDDAALAAAHYLCAAGGDLSQVPNLHRAVYAYNHDHAYVRAVLSVAAHYAGIDPSALGVKPVRKHHHVRRHRHHRSRAQATTSASPQTVRPAAQPGPAIPPSSTSPAAPSTTPIPEPAQSTPVVPPTPTDTVMPDPSGIPTPTDTPT